MRQTNLENWLEKRKALWWWVKDVKQLDEESILEGVMNYGRWHDFLDLKTRWGLKKIVNLYQEMVNRKRCNLRPPARVLFGKYLEKHAFRDFK